MVSHYSDDALVVVEAVEAGNCYEVSSMGYSIQENHNKTATCRQNRNRLRLNHRHRCVRLSRYRMCVRLNVHYYYYCYCRESRQNFARMIVGPARKLNQPLKHPHNFSILQVPSLWPPVYTSPLKHFQIGGWKTRHTLYFTRLPGTRRRIHYIGIHIGFINQERYLSASISP